MRKFLFFILTLQIILFAGCKNNPSSEDVSNTYLNLNFEDASGNSNSPIRWFLGEIGYKVERVQNSELENYAIKMTSDNPKEGEFGMALNYIPIDVVRGKTVVFKGRIKTENVTNGYAGLWCGLNQQWGPFSFEGWDKNGVDNTTDWQESSTEIYVDETANYFNFAMILNGQGTAWFDNLEIYIDGEKYTGTKARELNEEELAWLTEHIYPIKTFDPNEPSKEDLAVLDKLIGKSSVVALGEVTHGASEIYQMKDRIIRYLVEKNNYDIFSIEADMPRAYKVNEYTVDQKGKSEDYLDGMFYWVWNIKELQNLVEWMKTFNSFEKKIQFTGFDMQRYEGAISTLRDSLKQNSEILRTIDKLDSKLNENMQHVMKDPENTAISDEVKQGILDLTEKLRLQIKGKSVEDKEWLEQNIKIIEQSILNRSVVERDMAMADNFMWIKDRNPNSKFILWAHNFHISRKKGFMGSILSERLGADYVNVGFTFYEGSYNAHGKDGLMSYPAQPAYLGTYEYNFNKITDHPIFILDLRDVKKDESKNSKWLKSDLKFRSTGAVKEENEFHEVDLVNDYDLIIFIKNVTPSTLLKN